MRILALVAALALAAPVAAAAPAEPLVLTPRFVPGDTYNLSLEVHTRTEASSRGVKGEQVDEDVRLRYRASVLVVDVDESGRPVQERHRRVSLSFERPDGTGELFREGAAFDVERRDRVRILLNGEPIDRRVEEAVAEILEKQPEYTLEPAMLDPGRPVAVGESWELPESLTRRFLLSRGVRVIEFGEDATATLKELPREDGRTERVIEYHVPIERLELTRMPPHTEASRSDGSLNGRVRLAVDGSPGMNASVSELELSLSGISTGVARRLPWSLESTMTVEKSSPAGGDVALSEEPI